MYINEKKKFPEEAKRGDFANANGVDVEVGNRERPKEVHRRFGLSS